MDETTVEKGMVQFFAKKTIPTKKQQWIRRDLNPGPSACEADVIPLHHKPDAYFCSADRRINTGLGAQFDPKKVRVEKNTSCED